MRTFARLRGAARWLSSTVAELVLCVGLVLVLAAACGSRTTGEPRERSLTVEGQVHQLVGDEAFRVGAPGSTDRGILVLAIGHPQPRRFDTVRVVGVQYTLRLPEGGERAAGRPRRLQPLRR